MKLKQCRKVRLPLWGKPEYAELLLTSGHAIAKETLTLPTQRRARVVGEELRRECVQRVDEALLHHRSTKLDCERRCAGCCNTTVHAVPFEMFAVLDAVKRLPTATASTIRERARVRRDRTAGMSASQHHDAQMPCPLLVNDLCSIYAARPVACVAAHSIDRTRCVAPTAQQGAWHLPALAVPGALAAGVVAGAKQRGVDVPTLDFHNALASLLERPTRLERWLDGSDSLGDLLARPEREAPGTPHPPPSPSPSTAAAASG